MAWDHRNRSSSGRRGPAAMKELESSSSLQPWACSSLSTSEKFRSLYDKMLEDWEKKNFESLVRTRCLQQAPLADEQQEFPTLLPPTVMEKPGSMIVFPHITSRGSLVGKKVYCRTSIHSSSTWRQKSSTQRMHTSLMILNFYQDRSSSNSLLAEKQTTRSLPSPADSATSQNKQDHSPDKEQCRILFLSLAGAAGMRLMCPPLQLPLLEVLLFFRQQLSSKNRGGLWRFPVNLALATLRPFCGSLGRRCLTALLCLAQMRIKKNNITTEQNVRYMPVADLYTVVFEKETLDSKEFSIRSTNRIQIHDPVATTRTEADGSDVADRANENSNGTFLSNIVVARKFEEECRRNKGVPVVEILICERESLAEINNNLLVQDHDSIGFDSVCSEASLFSHVDLELEDDKLASSRRSFLKQKESQELIRVRTAAGDVLVPRSLKNGLFASRKRPYIVEEARNESFNESDFEGPMTFTNRMCREEEEQPETTSVSLTTCNLNATIDELADEQRSPRRGECNGVAAEESLETAPPARAETVENQLVNEFQDGESVLFVEGESADGLSELELEVCSIEKHRIGGSDCVSPELLQEQKEVFLYEGTSAKIELQKAAVVVPVEELSLALTEAVGNEAVKGIQEVKSEYCVEEKSVDRVLDCPIKDHTNGGSDCVSAEGLEGEIDGCLPDRTSGEDELEKAAVTVPEETLLLALTEAGEEQAIKDIHEEEFERYLEELSIDSVLDCPIEELIESLLEQTEVFLTRTTSAENELGKFPLTVPVEELSLALTEAVEDQAVRVIQEVKSIHFVEDKLADILLDQEHQVCPIEEHRIGGSDCISRERLQEQTEVFLSESTSAESELERATVTVAVEKLSQDSADVVENEDVKEIQEVKSANSAGAKSAERAFDEKLEVCPIDEDRIDDRSCVSSEGLQGYSIEVFLSERASAENELDENQSAAGAVVVPVENEAVKEIHEVESTQFVDGESEELFELDFEVWPMQEHNESEGLFELDLGVWSIQKHKVGHSDCVFPERAQRLRDVSVSDWTRVENEREKRLPPPAALILPVETQLPTSTEVLKNQAVKEIQEVQFTHSVEEKSAGRGLIEEFEVCPIEDHGTDDRNCVFSERLQGQEVEVFLPETTSAETELEKELSANLRGHFEAEFDGDASVPEQEESNCPSGNTIREHDIPSSPMTICAKADDDPQNEDASSRYHSGAISTESYLEHPELDLIAWTGESLLEPSTHTSLTSRLNSATEAENDALDPDSGAIAVVVDDINRDRKKDEHIETEAKVMDVISRDSISAHDDGELPPGPTETEIVVAASLATVASPSDECSLDQSSTVADKIDENCLPEMCHINSPKIVTSSTENYGVPESYPEHPFADHPTCIELRESRHSHEDQTYIDMQDLLPSPWGELIFWHGRCKEGRPTLCVLLGKAVRQLPGHELKHFIAVTVSHLEYAELNFFKGNVKQMNILMDLEGLGFMRLPPMNILSSIGAVLNRDYAGRGGWIILVNAPMMLGFVINAIQGVILRPSKGTVIDSSFKGFLDGKEKIMMMGSKYSPVLLRHFDASMLPDVLGGDCPCCSHEEPCNLGTEFLKSPWNTSFPI